MLKGTIFISFLFLLFFLQSSFSLVVLNPGGSTPLHIYSPPFTGNKNPIPSGLISFTLPIGLNASEIQSCVAANPYLPVCIFFPHHCFLFFAWLKKSSKIFFLICGKFFSVEWINSNCCRIWRMCTWETHWSCTRSRSDCGYNYIRDDMEELQLCGRQNKELQQPDSCCVYHCCGFDHTDEYNHQ